ncbi:twin-arginine translocation pathway signal protein [Acidovorax sp. Leaf76]|uniref:sulfatase family protein n=1 Tax=unclassified Acidovorax TaxID=2684926 RepID=UPI0006F9FC34|nr:MULTISPECIES: sulfatase-like hydrolase/transferase [unclassified Acidovorax]KQO13918.1 twin-arginine translocation pathway signal protein [Acidovorax sp. Leaf76]KQO31439.1 twin-arginine translocation pathway signal protein [Acidovorax sp. Leaf84]KQS27459.1 twin-arginine translocation pathway signal protein [Acidovorax sp. Leaf191]
MPQRPNIIFIVADDLGYADLGCYGGRDASFGAVSPVLDGLAARGLKLTQGYSNSPVCSPTRFALMTARYQYRLRGAAEEPINSKSRGSTTLGLPPDHPTLPSLLRAAGYRTALMGKWHLGYPPAFGPLRSGYEEFFGPMSGGVDYFTHCSSGGQHDLYLGDEEKQQDGYLTDLITDHALDYVERRAPGAQAGTPFFLSLHYTAPHWPWETRDDEALAQEVKGNLFHLHGGNIDTYRRMIHHMDEGIGRIMSALQRHGIDRDTLVVFTSDNGGERFSDSWPLVGGKMDLTEGGIRVPWIAHWPAVIAPGSVSPQTCMTMDWSATMLDAAGATPHADYPLDGRSLMPLLRDPSVLDDPALFWRMNHRGQRAMRQGDWKYLRVDGNDYLFNLAQDERERANRAPVEPERLQSMRAAWEAWNASMPAIPEDATVSLGYSVKDMPGR